MRQLRGIAIHRRRFVMASIKAAALAIALMNEAGIGHGFARAEQSISPPIDALSGRRIVCALPINWDIAEQHFSKRNGLYIFDLVACQNSVRSPSKCKVNIVVHSKGLLTASFRGGRFTTDSGLAGYKDEATLGSGQNVFCFTIILDKDLPLRWITVTVSSHDNTVPEQRKFATSVFAHIKLMN